MCKPCNIPINWGEKALQIMTLNHCRILKFFPLAFLVANIPLKLDDPAVKAYMTENTEWLIHAWSWTPYISSHSYDTSFHVSTIPCRKKLSTLSWLLRKKYVCDRCVYAVLFRTVTASSAHNVYLASCSFLNKANGTTSSQAILDTLNKFISFGIVSDSALYMGACFEVLKTYLRGTAYSFQMLGTQSKSCWGLLFKERT
ncbi:hypothetical protein PR048_020556 [Dryococelus australis]|uniref:Uncharacterized protein n=1 Tax=Dryococelus australis TaxID=614101 RepID=A0ABQ9H6L4_9NEOP|nr:hypothetical protein PR048_020556 [Dryococelus australis]